jgi:hypothetical protein
MSAIWISVKMNDAKKYFQNISSVNNESTHFLFCKYAPNLFGVMADHLLKSTIIT